MYLMLLIDIYITTAFDCLHLGTLLINAFSFCFTAGMSLLDFTNLLHHFCVQETNKKRCSLTV